MFRKFLAYYRPYRTLLIGVIIGTFVMAALDLVFPVVVRDLINRVLPAGDMRALLYGSAALLALYAFHFLVSFSVQYYGHVMSASMENDMRRALFAHIERLSFSYFDNEKTGQLLSRLTSDVSEVSELAFRGPNDILLCGGIMAGTLIAMFVMNWKLALLIGTLLVAKAWHTVVFNAKMKSAFRRNRAKAGELSARAEESLSGIRLVKAFGMEEAEEARFAEESLSLRDLKFKSYRLVAYFSGSINFFTNFINVAVLLAGGSMIYAGTLPLADFVAFLLYVNLFMRPVFRLTILAEVYQRGMAGFARVEEILAEDPRVADPVRPLSPGEAKGQISFEDVTFGYDPARPVLSHVSFTAAAGETVGFVGETGAGKSTVASLLLRFYDPDSGRITLDGEDLRDYAQADLRSRIGIVQQDVFLFSDSVADNIACGKKDATREEIETAARLAAADRFIQRLPEGLDTKVGERGVKLSGGQKQRIAIARVFLKNPTVVIFDEATSALDTQTEKRIQSTLTDLSRDRTTLIIAHRLSTVQNADRIFVLHHGKIAEEGNHEELMALKGRYYELYEAQKKGKVWPVAKGKK